MAARCMMVFVLTIMLFGIVASKTCHTVTKQDARIAAEACDTVYYPERFSVGTYIQGTKFKVTKVVSPIVYGSGLRCIVAKNDDENAVLVAFRGTIGTAQYWHQFRSLLRNQTRLQYGGTTVRVISYYWKAMKSFNPSTIHNINPNTKYIISGHSLGGAIASLFALYMRKHHSAVWAHPDSSLITFGAPRVGDALYAKVHDTIINPNRKLRFIYQNDVIPFLPTTPSYYHASREIWMRSVNVGGWFNFNKKYVTYWKACNLGDAKECSRKQLIKTKKNHPMRLYLKAVAGTPKGYYDRNDKLHDTFKGALCA